MKALALNTPFDMFLKEVDNHPLLSKKDEYNLAVKYYENEDLNAANKLVLSNLRFVIKIAGEYKSYGFPLMDLIQEGTIGLMHAVKKFNPYKGYRLISYAVWWIKARIHNHIMKFWSTVKIGTTQAQRKLFQKLSNAKRKLNINSNKLNNEEITKLANHFGVKEKDVVEMELRHASRDFSLDQNIEGDESVNYIDIIQDEDINQEALISDMEFKSIAHEGIKNGFEKLSEREKKIINERFYAEEPKKLHVLGEELGISKERVRQIEKTALKKLQKSVKALTL
ncbi:MAG: RNA polymerase factor sigma-32 [Thermodesulfobacteriota bacterium]